MSRPVGVAPRPTLAIRRRATIAGTAASSAVGVMTGTKRKPLPKIYGCAYESCGKKFDRPSTLKVHEAIHTGAKDHLCEYCRRAFTVQSNMKRHMRVCKHKPLSPPLSYCYFVCIPPGLPLIRPSFLSLGSQHPPTVKSSGSSSSPPSSSSMSASNSRLLPAPESQAMVRSVPTMSASSAAHLVNTVEPGSGLPFEIQSRASASIQGGNTLNRDNMNLSSYGSVDAVTGSPPEVVRGAKAPMVIAAMFSMQQNVPSSLAKFTLVQLECDAPVRPVRPHPKYTFLYRERDALAAAESMTSGSSAYISPVPDVVPGQTSSDAPIPGSGMTAMFVPGSTDTGEVDGQGDEKKKQEGGEDGEVAVVVAIDRSIRTQRLLPLPTDLFEERDSYYPRSRYCYHPAEYDSIMILPGPGIADLPIDDELGQTA
ncbi:hypothetical protein FRC15_000340 [Serendipita sp. 397]|nr:hypothetical protein FRC15_000340 [Serendipita sp. 397]